MYVAFFGSVEENGRRGTKEEDFECNVKLYLEIHRDRISKDRKAFKDILRNVLCKSSEWLQKAKAAQTRARRRRDQKLGLGGTRPDLDANPIKGM